MSTTTDVDVDRSITIDAPASTIYPHLIDFKAWQEWSPWEGLDPGLQRTYSENTVGPGATYAWKGNRKVGSGRMEILDATEPSELVVELEFFKSKNRIVFELTEAGGTTDVRWTMTAPSTVRSKVMGKVFPLDKVVGKDFEKGLVSLKSVSEASAG